MEATSYSFITARRVDIMRARLEEIHFSLYLTIMAVFIALLIALYKVRADILLAVKDR